MKIGRNDPCPCGSGQKYKRCCVDKHDASGKGGMDSGPQEPQEPQEPREVRFEYFPLATQGGDALDEVVNRASDPGLDDTSRTADELAQAESSLLVHLELYDCLGNKDGVACAYGNLGILYHSLGDLVPAESMYREALKLDEELGRWEGMAVDCGNLGRLCQTQGDLGQAAALYNRSMALFRQVGSASQMQQVQRLLDELTGARASPSLDSSFAFDRPR